jgi:hypothetical protein
MLRRARRPVVPTALVDEIAASLARVDGARDRLHRVRRSDPGLVERRQAHADLRAAFVEADALLREATRAAKAHSHREWSRWRHRLSILDTARQMHLFEESDDSGVVAIPSVRAIDTGMSGPAIGEFQHGACSPAGKRATYGLDLEAALLALDDPDLRGQVATMPLPSRVASDQPGAAVA